MPAHFSTELLVNLLLAHLAVEPDTLTLSAAQMAALGQSFIAQSNQGSFVLQIAPADDAPQLYFGKGGMRQLPELHALIRARTSIPAPEVAAYDFSRNLIDRDFLIMESKDGAPFGQMRQFNHQQYNQVLWQLGDMLKQLHAISGHLYGYDGPHHPMEPQATWKQAFGLMWRRLIADIARAGLYTSEEAQLMLRLWDSYKLYFERDMPPALLLMDMHKDHFLVDQDANLKGVLNFGHSLWGDPELDFAALDYAGIYASSFWQGYARSRPSDPDSQLRRRFYLMYEMQKHILISAWHENDIAGAEQSRQMVMTIADNIHP